MPRLESSLDGLLYCCLVGLLCAGDDGGMIRGIVLIGSLARLDLCAKFGLDELYLDRASATHGLAVDDAGNVEGAGFLISFDSGDEGFARL
jgi:hypothetical protein